MNIHVFLIFSIIYILIKLVCKILDCSTKIINTQVFWSMHVYLGQNWKYERILIQLFDYSIILILIYPNIRISKYTILINNNLFAKYGSDDWATI